MPSLLKGEYFLFSSLILLAVLFIIFCIILCAKKPKKRSEFRYDDIVITGFSSMNFIEAKSNPS